MKHRRLLFALPLLGLVPLVPVVVADAGPQTVPFGDARLKIEVNATAGDAGLQVFVDGEAWNQIAIKNPAGKTMVEVDGAGPLENYGLTELFSESSEPPFAVFPLEKFKKLFPEGKYAFRGTTIDGKKLVGEARLTHRIPDGPKIVGLREDATVPRDNLVIQWQPVTTPRGINIVGYQVIVTREDPLRVFSADLPAGARRMPVPSDFLQRNTEYAVEVAAIEAGGNQTFTEVAFRVT